MNMLPRRRPAFFLLLCFVIISSVSEAKPKRRRSLSRRPRILLGGSALINIQFVKARSAEIGFSYVQGAEKFLVQANEWVNNKYAQSVPTDSKVLRSHARSATLVNLIPGREYLIQVFPQDGNGKMVGGVSKKVVRTSQRCFICNGKRSNEACIGAKNSMDCPHDKDACLNEVRYSKGIPSVMKRCAQWRPELGKQIQNGQDMTTACTGRENLKDAACKCMCRSDLCNEAEMPCVDECFKELPTPPFSTLRCTNGVKIGSVCRWTCDKGMKMKGLRESECRKDRTWSLLSPPECIGDPLRDATLQCPALKPKEPLTIRCSDGFKAGSLCSFGCPREMYLKGDSTRQCDTRGKWSGEMPVCEEITCQKIDADEELTYSCTDGVRIGSVCEFSCPEGRKFVGKETLTCLPGGRWSSTYPRCTAPDCVITPKTFPHVLMECGPIPDGRKGKVCNFACEVGYQRTGAKQSYCYSGNSWTASSPTCRRILCRPDMIPPAFGFVRCSDRSFYGSECLYSCKEGYILRGTRSTACLQTGKWTTTDMPVCRKIQCPRIMNFNGLYSCTDLQNFGSVCMFSCKRGFGFEPKTQSKLTCISKSEDELDRMGKKGLTGKWDAPIPKCTRIGCDDLGPTPANSNVKCDSSSPYAAGTTCTYFCKSGFRLEGSRRTTCVARSDGSTLGDWSSPPPVCTRIECKWLPELEYGSVECTDNFFSGSKCMLNCEYGRFLTGKKSMTCDEHGKWSAKMPICKLVTCVATPGLMNGFFNCGDVERLPFNYECEASCSLGYELSMPGVATCGIEGDWLISEDLQCVDKNECLELDEYGNPTNGGCEHECINTKGSSKCMCRKGYKLAQDGKSCIVTICPTLDVGPKGHVSCQNKYKIGSACILECVPGYEASAAKRVTCQEGGTWNRQIGTCTRVSCPDLEIPPYGGMECSQGFKFGSSCEFSCKSGYELIGKSTTSCGADKIWTSEVPACKRIECDPSFLTMEYAVMECTDDNKYESMCHVSCQPGYEIRDKGKVVGIVKVHCLEDATWDADKPKCEKKRCQPTMTELMLSRPNGILSCTDLDWFGSTCKLECDEGYIVQGDFRIKCAGSAEWNKNLGTCEKIQCPAIKVPANGEMYCTEEAFYQSSCSFFCWDGYRMTGKAKTECNADRTWTNKPPVCERIECPDIYTTKLLKGTVKCTEGAYFGSTCEYKCEPGYEFVDTKTEIRKAFGFGLDGSMTFDIIKLKCSSKGLWGESDQEKPTCARHECIPPSKVLAQANPNGKLTCSDGDRFESVCELDCDRGYEVINGRASTQCKEDRQWGPRIGFCERVRCPMFEPLINGAIKCSNSNFYQSRCLFGCYPGYKLKGSPVSTCQWNREWDNDAPTCGKISCPSTHTKLENGNATCTEGSKFGSKCTYVCNPGYEMVLGRGTYSEDKDSVVLECKADGTWAGKLPYCRRKQCSMHDGAIAKAKLHGTVTCSAEYWYQSVCSVECNEGFELAGSPKTRCNANADWEPPLGFCKRKSCPPMKVPDYGSMECTNDQKFESVCKFTCKYGFELIGFKEAECLAMMYFSVKPPVCKEIICDISYLRLKDGSAECTNRNRMDSKCQFTCNKGYQLTVESPDSLECLKSYKWSGDKPVCEKKSCPEEDANLVKAAEFGTVSCSDANRYLSTCSVKCHPGYRLTEGGAFTTCRATQEWGPALGYCTKIVCDEMEPVENGTIDCTDGLRFESVCSFKCDPGFELTHTKSTTCQADKKFDVDPPECTKVDCPSNHMRIRNGEVHCTEGNTFGSVCKYECNAGFERVTGSSSAQCLADRTWDADKTGCERVQCDMDDILIMKAKEHGTVTCTSSNFYASVCTVKCDKGYELTGLAMGTTRCDEFAQWDGKLGYCTRIVCDKHAELSDGEMKCTDSNRYESECSFTCNEGFKMNGVDSSTCQADRTWTSDAPTCGKVTCSDSNLFLEHGTANCSEENKYLSVCWYACDGGYEMEEDIPNSMCLASRAWTTNKPTCIKKECDMTDPRILKALENGRLSCSDGSRYESVCSLSCERGYEIEGRSKIECLETAMWDKDIGSCERIHCKPLDIKPNSIMDCSNADRYESICMFQCEEGYEMRGASQTECLATRKFSEPPPTCIKTKCSSDYKDFAFGIFDCSEENYFESICRYSCDVGYRMMTDGPNVVTSECLSNQTWSLEVPICEKKTCPYDSPYLLLAVDHGTLTCTEGNAYGSTCSVTCHEGYELKGPSEVECTQAGRWNKNIGHCTKIRCPRLPKPPAAIISCSDEYYFNSTCRTSCERGYTFRDDTYAQDGEVTLTCTSSQTWTEPGSLPRCIKKECPKQYLRFMNGEVNCTDRQFYKSQCMFKCNPGYELERPNDNFDITTILLTCSQDGAWDSIYEPTCKRITCEPSKQELDEKNIHGKIRCTSGSNYESECRLECHKGYEITTGAVNTTCLEDGTWDPPLGKCDKISCPPISAPEFAKMKCTDDFRFKSQCHVICIPGFEIYDPENDYDPEVGLECKADGNWCGDAPTCTRVKCPPEYLSLVGGQAKCTNENLYQSRCKYSCDQGYQMIQGEKAMSVCTSHMTWSSPQPTCLKKRCPADETSIREAQENGAVTCTDENKYDSRCELECFTGYELSGEPNTTCLHTGEWSNGIGLCNEIDCAPASPPPNAVMKCTDGNRYESLCTFACKSGYMLTEDAVKAGNGIVCQADQTWVGAIIKCEKITCPAEGFSSLENGKLTCTDSNFFKSRCLFECDGGFELSVRIQEDDEHSGTVVCTDLGYWDIRKPPQCAPVQCGPSAEELSENFANGRVVCNKGSEFKSQCRTRCLPGYELVNGETMTICGSDKKWGPQLGACAKITCNEIPTPSNSKIVCDDGFRFGSQCLFECLPGFQKVIRGKSLGVMTCRADGRWEGNQPSCERIRCDSSYTDLPNGQVKCTDRNAFESECESTCSRGYELYNSASKIATCQADGMWSVKKPSCSVKTCKSEYAANGYMNCTGSEYNAVCELTCELGHKLVNGAKFSTCTDAKNRGQAAVWTPPLGDCEKIRCPLISEIANGNARCSDENKYRSVCYVDCEHGFEVKGVFFSTTCLRDGTWSRAFQTCERVTCDADYLDVDYGSVTATDGNYFRSILKYNCPNIGHEFTGTSSKVTCLVDGKWSVPKPKCERMVCPPLNLPNGRVDCTGKRYNDFGSICTYTCDENYERKGSARTECLMDGTWSKQPPYCKGHCDIKFDSFRNGGVECTNSHYHHSRCTFWCDKPDSDTSKVEYSLFGSGYLTCKKDGQWDGMPPCCAQNCPPLGKMDLFFVLDSSTSITYENWRKMLNFVNQLLQKYQIGEDNVLAGVVRFNRFVDTKNEIPIGKYKTSASLQYAIRFMPYGGGGTSTGKALHHVARNTLQQPGNRPDAADIVILFTDGASQDSVQEPADLLKAANVTIHVVGIQGSTRGLNFEQMTEMASHPLGRHISVIRDGFDHLTDTLSKRLGEKVCHNPCLLSQDYRERAESYIRRHADDYDAEMKKSDWSQYDL